MSMLDIETAWSNLILIDSGDDSADLLVDPLMKVIACCQGNPKARSRIEELVATVAAKDSGISSMLLECLAFLFPSDALRKQLLLRIEHERKYEAVIFRRFLDATHSDWDFRNNYLLHEQGIARFRGMTHD